MSKPNKRITKPTTLSEKVFAYFLPLPNAELFKLTVSDIADKLGCTGTILITTFKNETGHNLCDVLENQKLLAFSILISKPQYKEMPINAIIKSFNIGTPYYFRKRFEKFFCVSPSVYRQLSEKRRQRELEPTAPNWARNR